MVSHGPCCTRQAASLPKCRSPKLATVRQRTATAAVAAAEPSPAATSRRRLLSSRQLSIGRTHLRPEVVRVQQRVGQLSIQCTYPEPETEKERSPIDIPQEWITPQPSRRPDIFPEWEKLETPLPKPMPGDPELPDEDEEEEKKKKKDPNTDPDKDPEEPDKKPDEPAPSE
ncbi:hypothetical protein N2152v2_004390 [Parachlorella kessleri]